MGTADVAIWTTAELHNTDPDAQSKIIDQLNFAFNYAEHDVNVVRETTHHPDPPTEEIFESFENTDDFCGHGGENYSGLLSWWQDYHRCKSIADAADSNILVTDSTSLGGRGYIGGRRCVAAGHQIKNFSSSDIAVNANGTDNEAMQTVIHEIGHNLGLDHPSSSRPNASIHGYIHRKDSDEVYPTYMAAGYIGRIEGTTNECGQNNATTDSNDTVGNRMIYSECSEDVMADNI